MDAKTMSDVLHKLNNLQRGESFIYHTGFSLVSCPKKVRNAAYKAAMDDRVHLTQRRLGLPVTGTTLSGHKIVDWYAGLGPGFEYIATCKTWKSPKKHVRVKDLMTPRERLDELVP